MIDKSHENKLTKIKAEALRLGFSACGFSKAEFLEKEKRYLEYFLENNFHGEMLYLENHFEKRLNPKLLVENSKTVISVLLNYFPKQKIDEVDNFKLSKYAYGIDYHIILKEKLQTLFQFINTEIEPIEGRVFTDSAPVLEKAWALKAGLGWLGKNGLLLTKKGSYFFIGEIICTLNLDSYFEAKLPENKLTNYCGTCTRCLEACPTKAIEKPHIINATKCISYLTIEQKGEIPSIFKGKLENYLYGCDICQDVCPWNKKAISHTIAEFEPSIQLLSIRKKDWQNLTPSQFSEMFKNSAVKRTKYNGLMRTIHFLEA